MQSAPNITNISFTACLDSVLSLCRTGKYYAHSVFRAVEKREKQKHFFQIWCDGQSSSGSNCLWIVSRAEADEAVDCHSAKELWKIKSELIWRLELEAWGVDAEYWLEILFDPSHKGESAIHRTHILLISIRRSISIWCD